MSTSFYVKLNKRKRNSLIQEINSSIINENFEKSKTILELLRENKDFGIKLGKVSCGWQFAWYHHKGILFDINLKSIKNFLEKDINYIIDEYGSKYDSIKFLDYIKEKLYKNHEHMDFESYYKKHPNELIITLNHDEDLIEIEKNLYQAHLGEFKSIDGLRFYIDNSYE